MQDLVTFSLFNQSGHKRCRHRLGMGWIEYPSVPHRPPQFNTSVPLLDHTFSAPKIPQTFTTPDVHHLRHSPPQTFIIPFVNSFSLLSMFDCFKYHQPLLGLPSTALVQGCLDCRNILHLHLHFAFFFWG